MFYYIINFVLREIEVCSSMLGPLRWSGGHKREIVFSGGNAQLWFNTYYSTGGMVIKTQDTNYSIGGMVMNTKGTNYFNSGMAINTQDTN